MSKVSSKGQVTIPKEIRDALGIGPGSKVEFKLEDGRAILRKGVPAEALDKWEGYLRGRLPSPTVDGTVDLLRGDA